MSKRLIDAKLAQHIANVELIPDQAGIVLWVLSHTPTIDAVEVVHGRWVDHLVRDWRCSECGKKVPKQVRFDGYYYDDKLNYCPNCGAKMDGDGMGMAELMIGKELHPDRVIPVEKLYEILNEYEIPSSFPAQHGIENNAFSVVRCKDCRWARSKDHREPTNTPSELVCQCFEHHHIPAPWYARFAVEPDDFCSYGERRTDG